MKIRTYSDISCLQTYKERFDYLKLDGSVGFETFGFERYLNQAFYRSAEWKTIRNQVIIRDNGCDLGVDGYEIHGKLIIHHMNPIMVKDIRDITDELINPEYLICVSQRTHNAIHYGNSELSSNLIFERHEGDTCPWKG